MEQYKQEFIEFMVDSEVLKFGEFTLKSGRKSPFFMNAGLYVTGAQLEKLGVNTNVDPEKVLTLVKEQDGKVSELSAALKETTAKIDALRQAQRIVKEIYQQPKEPQEKRKERENQEL